MKKYIKTLVTLSFAVVLLAPVMAFAVDTPPPASVTFTFPTKDATLYLNSSFNIAWKGYGEKVKLYLTGGSLGATEGIVLTFKNQGVSKNIDPYNFVTISILEQNGVIPGSGYKLRMKKDIDGVLLGESPSFTLALHPIIFTSPAAGDVLNQGSNYDLTYSLPKDASGGAYRLSLVNRSSGKAKVIDAYVIPSSWTVPFDVELGSNYRLELDGISSRSVNEIYIGPLFTIAPPIPLVFTFPTADATLFTYSSYKIKWTGPGPQRFSSYLVYLTGGSIGAEKNVIGSAKDSSFSWRISSTIIPGSGYQLLILDAERNVRGASPLFTIAKK